MLIILSWEDPVWRLYSEGAEAEGPTIEEAFGAFYDAMTHPPGPVVEIVHDHSSAVPGMYHIRLLDGAPGRLRAVSSDILGLSLEGAANEVLTALPSAVVAILRKQEHYGRIA